MQVEFPGAAGVIFAHRARPRHGKRRKNDDDGSRDATAVPTRVEPLPGILVIHENRGLNEHIRDVTRRAARAGFVALGIDLLSRLGGTPSDPEEAQRLYQQTTPEGRLADMLSALAYLQGLDIVRGDKLGAVDCAGGGNVWTLALNTDLLAAAVAYYGLPCRQSMRWPICGRPSLPSTPSSIAISRAACFPASSVSRSCRSRSASISTKALVTRSTTTPARTTIASPRAMPGARRRRSSRSTSREKPRGGSSSARQHDQHEAIADPIEERPRVSTGVYTGGHPMV